MRAALRAGALIVALVACVLVPRARADDAAEARFHDARARAHYDAGRFELAIEEFFLSARLAPSPGTTFNLALSFERLRREEEAYQLYAEYMASDDADSTRRAYVRQALARLEPRVARLRVASQPSGATVFVDDRDRGVFGTTPCVLALPPGSHTILMELDGHLVREETLELVRGEERAIESTLEPIVGRLEVRTVADAAVTVRDAEGVVLAAGRAPLEATLAPGAVTVEVVAPGYRTYRDVTVIVASETRALDAPLEPLPPATAELTVTASAPGAIIEVDGEPAGFAPTVLEGLAIGDHAVRVRSEDLDPYEGSVSLVPDRRGWLTVTLVPPARTTRSDSTWVLGGVALAGAVAWGTLLGVSQTTYAQFDSARRMEGRTDLEQLWSQGRSLDVAADVLLAASLTAAGVAVVLFFVTESTEAHESSAVYSATEEP